MPCVHCAQKVDTGWLRRMRSLILGDAAKKKYEKTPDEIVTALTIEV